MGQALYDALVDFLSLAADQQGRKKPNRERLKQHQPGKHLHRIDRGHQRISRPYPRKKSASPCSEFPGTEPPLSLLGCQSLGNLPPVEAPILMKISLVREPATITPPGKCPAHCSPTSQDRRPAGVLALEADAHCLKKVEVRVIAGHGEDKIVL